MRIYITGYEGQLGKALVHRLTEHQVFGGDVPDFDVTRAEQVMEVVSRLHPDVVLHTAAMTDVDYCAQHPQEAVRVNGVGTYNVALACRALNAAMVTISTNEVFDGTASSPCQEYDSRNPVNPYGYSKLVAEQVTERIAPKYYIVRTAWLFASTGRNFIHKIIEQARAGKLLRVVADEVSSPTYAADLADALADLIETGRYGIYHLTNAGGCSRYEFAQQILQEIGLAGLPITPITQADFERASVPPVYSPLANVFGAAAGVRLRSWQSALADYISKYE